MKGNRPPEAAPRGVDGSRSTLVTRDGSGPQRVGLRLARPRRPSASEVVKFLGEAINAGVLGVEGAAAPGEHVMMLLVCRIGDRGKEVGIAPRPAHVLGRAAADRGNELRVAGLRIGLADALDPDGMVPTVAKIIEVVDRPGAGILDDI